MSVEIYSKVSNYTYFNPNEIEVSDDIEIFLQNIEMLLTTPKGSLLGDPDFGIDLQSYIWETRSSSSTIKQEIFKQMSKYISLEIPIPFDIEVNFLKGAIWDTMIVDLIIDGKKVAGYSVTP